MIIILSPAKRMSFQPLSFSIDTTSPLFRKEAWRIAGKMKEYSPVQLTSLLGVNTDLALSTAERFASFQKTPLEIATKPALFAYKGDAYRGLDAETLSSGALDFARQHLRILSALYGILRPFDAIQPYRLEMATKLHVNNTKNLYEFWQKCITTFLKKELKKDPLPVLINLASREYFSVIDTEKLQVPVITPVFKEYLDRDYKVRSIYAKVARGKMTRFILENRISNPEELKTYNEDGYAYDDNLSGEDQWVFTR